MLGSQGIAAAVSDTIPRPFKKFTFELLFVAIISNFSDIISEQTGG
jgi:hypothetical protein